MTNTPRDVSVMMARASHPHLELLGDIPLMLWVEGQHGRQLAGVGVPQRDLGSRGNRENGAIGAERGGCHGEALVAAHGSGMTSTERGGSLQQKQDHVFSNAEQRCRGGGGHGMPS